MQRQDKFRENIRMIIWDKKAIDIINQELKTKMAEW